MVTITLVKSLIGQLPKTKKTAMSLGLKRIGDTKTLKSDAVLEGKLAVLAHLVKVEKTAE